MFSYSFIVFSNTSSSSVFSVFYPFFYYMFPTIFTSFLHGFLHHFLWFPAFSYIFNVFCQQFYPSPSFSDGFCSISFGCYHIFLHFHCVSPAFLLHPHVLFLAFAPVSSIFQGILHGLFLAYAPASSIFHGILYDFF